MTREEAIKILVRLPLLRMCTRDTMDKVSDALNMAIEALNNIQVLDKIPKDYLYDAETNEFLVYRNKYTGKEIHILKPTDLFVLERPHGEWEYLKEHITEMRDANGALNQKQTCQFILELMKVIENEGDT